MDLYQVYFTIRYSTFINYKYKFFLFFSGDKERINELVQKAWIFINDR